MCFGERERERERERESAQKNAPKIPNIYIYIFGLWGLGGIYKVFVAVQLLVAF